MFLCLFVFPHKGTDNYFIHISKLEMIYDELLVVLQLLSLFR